MNRKARTSSIGAGALNATLARTVFALGLTLCLQGVFSRAEASAPRMEVQSATGAPGADVTLGVVLRTNGAVVASTTSEILFDSQIRVASAGAKGDCTANPTINHAIADFRFSPNGCNPVADCTGVRGIVLTTDAVPDGTVLFTCRVQISANASLGAHQVRLDKAAVSDPQGNEAQADVAPGVVTVAAQLGEVSRPSGASSTTAKDGGCNLAPEADPGRIGFLLFGPLLALAWRRQAMRRRAPR